MLHSGYAHAGFAATTSTTKGGEDITNSQSELDSLPDTDDESQGSESDTDSEAHHSEDHHSDEDVSSTSTTDSEMEYDERHSTDPDEEIRNGNFSTEMQVSFGFQDCFIHGPQRSFSPPERKQGPTWADLQLQDEVQRFLSHSEKENHPISSCE